MIRSRIAAIALAAGMLAFGTVAIAEEKKEVKLTGTLVCGRCNLKMTPKCSNLLQVKEGGKVINYFLDDRGNKEEYHEGVCGGEKVEGVTVTGSVTNKDGKKYVKPASVVTKGISPNVSHTVELSRRTSMVTTSRIGARWAALWW